MEEANETDDRFETVPYQLVKQYAKVTPPETPPETSK
jgi:hypothetical protein